MNLIGINVSRCITFITFSVVVTANLYLPNCKISSKLSFEAYILLQQFRCM